MAARTWLVGAPLLGLLVPLLFAAVEPPARHGKVPSPAVLRQEHAALTRHLDEVRRWAGELQGQAPERQRQTMKQIVGFFEGHIAPHAAEEEKGLYPEIDALTKTDRGPDGFTTSMRYEHGVVARWIGELAKESRRPTPDVKAFTRRTDNLLGLLEAHFEEEEHVLLPILERQGPR